MTNRLGVAGGPVPREVGELTPQHAAWLSSLGVRCLVTHFLAPPEDLAGPAGHRVRQVLADAGLGIVQMAGANTNLVQPDHARLAHDLVHLRHCFAAASALGAEMIITGCGTFHPTFFYGSDRRNYSPEARERLIANLRRIAPMAEEHGIPLALECHVLTTLDTPAHIREVLDAVDSPWIKANFDPVNMVGDLASAYDTTGVMQRYWEEVGRHFARSAHIKDVIVEPDIIVHLREGAPGEGLLDLDQFFDVCLQLGDDAAIVVEHLPKGEAVSALEMVLRAGSERGVHWT